MRSMHCFAVVVFSLCVVSPGVAQDEETVQKPAGINVLTRGRAAEILASSDVLSTDVARQLENLRDPYEAGVVDDVRDAMADSFEWRWYFRDGGLLLAIPVKERLALMAGYGREKVFADVVRRLINQKGFGNPPVQVVFIEPRDASELFGSPRWQSHQYATRFSGASPSADACECH